MKNRTGMVLALAIALSASACSGASNATVTQGGGPGPPADAASFACPVPPTTIPSAGCNSVTLNEVKLTCGGTGRVPFTVTQTRGGADRFEIFLADGTLFTTKATPVNGLCWDGLPIQIGITLGLVYTGEVGLEIGTGASCVIQSRVTYTQFSTADPLIALVPGVEGIVKDRLHELLDKELIGSLGGNLGRCARWRLLPV
jgi:hypothetical protein